MSEFFIIRKSKEVNEILDIGKLKFCFFEVINDHGEVIDVYDTIIIDSSIKVDMIHYDGQWCTRVFPDYYINREHNFKLLDYDLREHKIFYKEREENNGNRD